ncbi:MAG: peptide deformylase [Patescibacteria group bacterium]
MILDIIKNPNPILRKISDKVNKNDVVKYQQMVLDMTETMLIKDGVGLAAPQVGSNIQLIVISKEADKLSDHLVLFNPRITDLSLKTVVMEEGCLSLPGIFKNVERAEKIRIKALDKNGEKIHIKAKGFLARVLQHEIDHLHGILFIDKAQDNDK